MISGFSEIIWRNSPEYLTAYQEGYEQARKEMREFLEGMKALYDVGTGTVSAQPPRREN